MVTKQNHIVTSGLSGASQLQDHVVVTMEDDASALPIFDEDEKNAIVLDPENSARQYYSDPFTGLKREIWRPGQFPRMSFCTMQRYCPFS